MSLIIIIQLLKMFMNLSSIILRFSQDDSLSFITGLVYLGTLTVIMISRLFRALRLQTGPRVQLCIRYSLTDSVMAISQMMF